MFYMKFYYPNCVHIVQGENWFHSHRVCIDGENRSDKQCIKVPINTNRKKKISTNLKQIVCIKGEIEFGQTPYSQCSQCSQIEAIISRMERLYEIIVRENIDEGILLNAKLYTIITWLRDIHTVHKLWVVKVDWRIYTFLFHIDPIAHLQCAKSIIKYDWWTSLRWVWKAIIYIVIIQYKSCSPSFVFRPVFLTVENRKCGNLKFCIQ